LPRAAAVPRRISHANSSRNSGSWRTLAGSSRNTPIARSISSPSVISGPGGCSIRTPGASRARRSTSGGSKRNDA